MSSGYLYFSDEGRHEYLVDEFGTFTDTRPSDPKLAERQVALVCFEPDEVGALALMARGSKAASYKWRVKLQDFVRVDPPIPLNDVAEHLEGRAAAVFQASRRGVGTQFDGSMWDAVRLGVSAARPDVAAQLDDLELRASRSLPTSSMQWVSRWGSQGWTGVRY